MTHHLIDRDANRESQASLNGLASLVLAPKNGMSSLHERCVEKATESALSNQTCSMKASPALQISSSLAPSTHYEK